MTRIFRLLKRLSACERDKTADAFFTFQRCRDNRYGRVFTCQPNGYVVAFVYSKRKRKLKNMSAEWESIEEIEIFRKYLRIPSVHPNINYG